MRTKSFIIHLARATARRHLVDRLIDDCPVPAQIVDAVDGQQLDRQQIAAVYQRDLFEPHYPFTLRNAEIGCFLSHRLCWQKIVDEDLPHALVFEDDAVLESAVTGSAIKESERHIEKAGYIQFSTRSAPRDAVVVSENQGVRLLRSQVVQLRLTGQLISQWAARRLLQKTQVFDRPVDTCLQMHWITGIRPMIISPSGLSDHASDAGGSTISAAKSTSERIGREVQRFAYRTKIRRLSKRHSASTSV